MTEHPLISLADVQAIVDAHKTKPGPLLPILHGIQDFYGYIPKASVSLIAENLNLSRAEVHGVMSFYHYFRHEPTAKQTIYVCRAEACQAMGSRELEAHIKETLEADYQENSSDGNLHLEAVYCLGNCACSPNIRLGDNVHGRMDTLKFDRLYQKIKGQPQSVEDQSLSKEES